MRGGPSRKRSCCVACVANISMRFQGVKMGVGAYVQHTRDMDDSADFMLDGHEAA
jgi:hypothetical protein